jgi:hypothetical protein
MPGEIQEFRGAFTDIMAITELRGTYPNVPISPDVDYEALIAGDSDPTFLTLPVGKVNAKSLNDRYYDESFITELMRQTLANKPVGLMGHLPTDQRAWAMPTEAVHWVGAVRDGDLLWGKGYIPPGPARERIRLYKAQGKTIATSIDAYAAGTWDESLKAYRMQASTLKLGQIDLAPADRAGIPDLASVPHLTTEMNSDPEAGQENEPMDKLQIIRELTVDDAQLLPATVRNAILATVQPAPEVATVAAIRETLGIEANADPVQAITEMRRTQTEQAKAAVTTKITELVNDPEKGIKAEKVRPVVTELINARNPQTVTEVEAAYKAVSESDAVKALLAAHVVETMGPAQRTSVQAQNGQPGRYFTIPNVEA